MKSLTITSNYYQLHNNDCVRLCVCIANVCQLRFILAFNDKHHYNIQSIVYLDTRVHLLTIATEILLRFIKNDIENERTQVEKHHVNRNVFVDCIQL